MSSKTKSLPTMMDVMAAYLAGEHADVAAMLARYPAKLREGIRATLAGRKHPEKLRRKLAGMGFKPEQIGPLPSLAPDTRSGSTGRQTPAPQPPRSTTPRR